MKEATIEEQQDFVKEVTKMSVDFDRWYTDVVRKAEMADWSGVRGMMVVRPYGWAMWENITRAFDDMIKESGHENWAFPLLIPQDLLVKEAAHIEGFGPEVAWVTKAGAAMEELEEPLAVRPTSETIIGHLIRRYIQSHRDLPKLTNQWNSVVRWEMRSRLFLRSREFWWQEGHTFHASAKEAIEEAELILGYYRSIAEDWLAVPVFSGKKSAGGDFPRSGAHAHSRGADARRHGAADGHVALLRPELRPRVRHLLLEQGQRERALLLDLVGHQHPPGRRSGHGARRRFGSGRAS